MMKAVGITAEYNPFHNGHVYHAETARQMSGADCVIAVMSGDFTQRGEPAVCGKWERARAAVTSGAVDLVICAKTLQDGKVAPTIHLDSPDPDCDLDYTPHTARDFAAGLTISNSFGFGGQNACVALRKI